MKQLLAIILSTVYIHPLFARTLIITDNAPTPSLLTRLQGERTLHLSTFNDKQHTIQIIDEGSDAPKYGNLSAALRHTNCIIGTNGGFFDKDSRMTPLGLLITNGTIVSPISTNGFTSNGILYSTGNQIHLKRRQNIHTPLQEIKQAIQSGPFLVENGRIVSGLNNNKTDTRTFIATDNAGNWCLGISTPITLHELALWLTKINPGFKIKTALNLDGGSSSTYQDRESNIYIRGIKRVRNYLGIKRK